MKRAAQLALVAVLVVPASAVARPKLRVVSSRPQLVSGGIAVVRVSGSRRGLTVRLNGRPITRAFHRVGGHALEGVVRGLRRRRNRLVAVRHGHAARLTLTNHPSGGPLLAGPQVGPWTCEAGALDAHCTKRPQFDYLYHSTNPAQPELAAYNPKAPPDDVATTTTDQGVKVPFVVRREIGYEDRDQYTVLTLFDPSKRWSRWHPQKRWNGKLLIPGGGGCGGDYHSSGAPLVDFSGTIPAIPGRNNSYVDALGRGFAVMSTALDNTGHNCNLAVEAESLIMAKAHFIERYGDIRYTIGTGCSGGSVVQNTVSNAYPRAVYDGLVITCAFPDVLSAGAQYADFHMLRGYLEDPSQWGLGVAWTPSQMAAVEGQLTPVDAIVADEALLKSAINPVGTCVDAKHAYQPQTNPGGVRCDVLDYQVNLLGRRPRSVWTPFEVKAGHGFAGFPFSNRGVEYGLTALRSGLITPDAFVDLNAKVGGIDINGLHSAARLQGDNGAVRNAYRDGLVNEEKHMGGVAIIDHAGPDPGIAHDFAHTYWIRWRLDKALGNHGNNVIWYGPTPLIGDPTWPTAAIVAMDRWLARVHADHSGKPLARRIREDRPADVHDRCETAPGGPDAACPPALVQMRLSTPREVAGGNDLNDVLKCRLKPLNRKDDYGPLGLSDDQFAQLQKIFPNGVCDWSKPGVGQQRNIPWLTYQTARGRVIYGGRRLTRTARP